MGTGLLYHIQVSSAVSSSLIINSGTSTLTPCNCSNATFVGVSTGQWNIIGCCLQSPDVYYRGVLHVSSWSTNQSSFSTQLLHCGHVSELNAKLYTLNVPSHTGHRTNLPFLPARVRPVTFSKCSLSSIAPPSDTIIFLCALIGVIIITAYLRSIGYTWEEYKV